jgi:ring-1,2-phenylacetyl-CoA epoxidase subunit PaaD
VTSVAPVDPLVGRILEVLSVVPDPEIPAVSLADLGILRGVEKNPAGDYQAVLTPTYSGCPATKEIADSVRAALDANGLTRVGIRSRLSPAWTTDWITEEGREKLRAYGISPPARGEGRPSLRIERVSCPRCSSAETEEISHFGSTPCKSMWRCLSCREPFEHFKCH